MIFSLLLVLTIISGAQAITKTLPPVDYSNPTLILNFSEAVTINGANLTRDGILIDTFTAGDFVKITDDKYSLSLQGLQDGYHELIIHKQDPLITGELGDLGVDTVKFRVQIIGSPLGFQLTSPRALYVGSIPVEAWAKSDNYDIIFNTEESASCNYIRGGAQGSSFSIDDGSMTTEHKLENVNFHGEELIFECTDSDNNKYLMPPIYFDYYNTPLEIDAYNDPEKVTDILSKESVLVVESNRKLFCNYTSTSLGGTSEIQSFLAADSSQIVNYLENPEKTIALTGTQHQEFTYNIRCMDKAGWQAFNTTEMSANFTGAIIVTKLSPPAVTNSENFTVAVLSIGTSNYLISDCYFDEARTSLIGAIAETTHYSLLTNLVQGDNSRSAYCTANFKDASKTFTFNYDTQAPDAPEIKARQGCEDEFFIEVIPCNSRDCEEADSFNYALYYGDTLIDSENSSDTDITFYDDQAEIGNSYNWKVIAYDLAGNPSSVSTESISVYNSSAKECDFINPSLYINVTDKLGFKEVNVSCVDDESGCTNQFNYSLVAVDDVCTYEQKQSYSQLLSVKESAKLCYSGEDLNGNSYSNSKVILVNSSSETQCFNQMKDGSETDVDCGGSCGPCETGAACTQGYDCLSLNCVSGVCENASCDDGISNGDETDIDCGGNCNACLEGSYCDYDSDCLSSTCISGVCENASCDDGISNGDETGIDCGGSCEPCENTSCDDGILNGDETDIDCGGNDCNGCLEGSKCIYNSDCAEGLVCSDSSGICKEKTINENKGMNTLGLVLLLLGLLMMLGAGYWLYYEHKNKLGSSNSYNMGFGQESQQSQMPESQMTKFSTSSQNKQVAFKSGAEQETLSSLSSEQKLALANQAKSQNQRSAEEKKKQARESLIDNFKAKAGEENKDKSYGSEDLPSFEEHEFKDDNSKDEPEFIDIRDIGKKEKKYTEQPKVVEDDDHPVSNKSIFNKKKKKKEIDKTFNDLDNLIDDKEENKK